MLGLENTKRCIFQNGFPMCLLNVALSCSENLQHFGAMKTFT